MLQPTVLWILNLTWVGAGKYMVGFFVLTNVQ